MMSERLVGGEWVRDGDDGAAKCKTPGVVSEASAGGEGGWARTVEVMLSMLLRRVIVVFLLPFLLMACSQQYKNFYVNDIALQQKRLPFLEDSKTTKEEVKSKLSVPFYEYKDGRIWTYIMLITEEGPLVADAAGHYHLVLVFDENNILEKHSLLRFKP